MSRAAAAGGAIAGLAGFAISLAALPPILARVARVGLP